MARPNVKRFDRRERYEASRPRVVRLDGESLVFDEKINSMAHRDFMLVMNQARARQLTRVILDFRRCRRAYADGMLPIICGIDDLRRADVSIELLLPEDVELRRLFLNANWAHFLVPGTYEKSNTAFDRHMALQQFNSFHEQQAVVNEVLDVAMRTTQMTRDVLEGLEWSINEITDNVLNHAMAPNGGLVQVTTYREQGLIGFVVADSGQGILASMKEGHPHLGSDRHAIGEAVKAGVTRNPEAGQGNGLAGTLRIATLSGGSFALTSGQAQLVVSPSSNGTESNSFNRRPNQRFSGTLVAAFVRQTGDFRMSDALAFPGYVHTRFDIIDANYETDDGSALLLRLANETAGFGTRGAGRQIRTKCRTLLEADDSKPLVLDWSGVPVISSSFADEFVAKLFVELGPTAYMARVRSVGMEALVRGLVDKAIIQRSAQSVREL